MVWRCRQPRRLVSTARSRCARRALTLYRPAPPLHCSSNDGCCHAHCSRRLQLLPRPTAVDSAALIKKQTGVAENCGIANHERLQPHEQCVRARTLTTAATRPRSPARRHPPRLCAPWLHTCTVRRRQRAYACVHWAHLDNLPTGGGRACAVARHSLRHRPPQSASCSCLTSRHP